jgi:cobalt/nickel transport system ATP-binding protein
MYLVQLDNIEFSYENGPQVLDGLNFSVEDGQRIVITGPNGTGKTTLFHLILGLLKPSAGEIRAFGRQLRTQADFRECRNRTGLLFQDPDDQLFCPSVIEDVAFGPLNQGKTHGQARAIAEETLDALGILHLKDRVPYHLSGGEKRIAALATILSMRPELLLLDEPTAGLAPRAAARLLEILCAYPARAIVVISHDSSFIEGIGGIRLTLDRGRLSQAC